MARAKKIQCRFSRHPPGVGSSAMHRPVSYAIIWFDAHHATRCDTWWAIDEGQKVMTRKAQDGQKTLFTRNVWGPLGCHLLSSLVPKSRSRGSRKKIVFKMRHDFYKRCRITPLSIFRPWFGLNPHLDLIYQHFTKCLFCLDPALTDDCTFINFGLLGPLKRGAF